MNGHMAMLGRVVLVLILWVVLNQITNGMGGMLILGGWLIYDYVQKAPSKTAIQLATDIKFWAILGGFLVFEGIMSNGGINPILGYLAIIAGAVIYNRFTQKPPSP